MLSYAFTEEQEDLRQMVREFAQGEVLPLVEEAERTEKFPVELMPKLGELVEGGRRAGHQHDAAALRADRAGDLRTDAAGGPCDDDRAAVETEGIAHWGPVYPRPRR